MVPLMDRLVDNDYGKAIIKVDAHGRVDYEGHADYVLVVLKTAQDIHSNRENTNALLNVISIAPVLLAIILVGTAILTNTNVQKTPQPTVSPNGVSTPY
jgi:hypothetical protein